MRHARRSVAPAQGCSGPCRAIVSSLVVHTPGPTNTSSSTTRERGQVDAALHAHARADARRRCRRRCRGRSRDPCADQARSRTNDWSPMIAPQPMLAPANTTAPAPTLHSAPSSSGPTSPRARGVARQPRALAEHGVVLDDAAVADDRAGVHDDVRSERDALRRSRHPRPRSSGRARRGPARPAGSLTASARSPRPCRARDAAQVDDQARAPGDQLVVDARVRRDDQREIGVGERMSSEAARRSPNSGSAGTWGSW